MEPLKWEYFTTIVYFILFNTAILSLTVSLHELGHGYLGLTYGCNGKIVLLDLGGEGTYTSLECKQSVSEKTLALGSFIFTLPLSFIFLLLGKLPEKIFFFCRVGFGAFDCVTRHGQNF